jgi:hypothetical protein
VLVPHEHKQSKTPHDPQRQTEAHLYGPSDCSAYVRSRWLFDRTTAVPPKHVEPFRLRICLKRWRSASDTQPPCRVEGFDFYGRRTLSYLISFLSPRIPFQQPETSSRPQLGLGIGAGGLEKHEDMVGLDQAFRSVNGENNGGFRRLGAT